MRNNETRIFFFGSDTLWNDFGDLARRSELPAPGQAHANTLEQLAFRLPLYEASLVVLAGTPTQNEAVQALLAAPGNNLSHLMTYEWDPTDLTAAEALSNITGHLFSNSCATSA